MGWCVNADQFVNRFGWEKAKEFSQITINGLRQEYCFEINTGESVGLAYVNLDDLKRLVESWELVVFVGHDLDGAKRVYNFSKEMKYLQLRGKLIALDDLQQAIADVEACKS